MVRKLICTGICLVLFLPLVNAQELLFDLEGEFKTFHVDHMENLYTINSENVIRKYDENFQLKYSDDFNLYGELTFLDVTNPLNLLMFYKKMDLVVFTDNTLAILTKVDFNRIGFPQVYWTCRSSQPGLWIFDGSDFRIKRIDEKGTVLGQSENLYTYLENNDARVNYMVEYDQRLYLNIPSTGILVFDIYGNYLQTIPLLKIRTFVTGNDVLYCWKPEKFVVFDLTSFETKKIELSSGLVMGAKEVRFLNKKLYILTDKRLKIYQFSI